MSGTLVVLYGLFVLAAINFSVYFTRNNNRTVTRIGIALFLLSPVFYYLTFQFVRFVDSSAVFGAGIVAFLYTGILILNSIVVLWISGR